MSLPEPVSVSEAMITGHIVDRTGTSGYHHYLVNHKIAWESEAHYKEADRLYEEIATSYKAYGISKGKEHIHEFEGSEWQTGKYFERRGYNSERWRH